MTVKDVKVTVSIDASLKEQLVAYCEERDVSMSAVLRQALRAFLQESDE